MDLKGRWTVLFHGDNIFSSQKTIGDFQPIGDLPWDFPWDLITGEVPESIFEREGVLRPLLACKRHEGHRVGCLIPIRGVGKGRVRVHRGKGARDESQIRLRLVLLDLRLD